MMKNALGTTLAVEKYGSSFFKNGAQPAGVLEHPGVLKDPQKIRDNWMNAYGGAGNAHKVAVLEEGMAYKPISLPPEDSQFLSTREFGVEEICRIFRVPPHMVQDLKRATFNNIEHQSIDFVMHTIMPWLVRIEQAIIKDVLIEEEQDTYFPKFNVDGLMRGDYKSRMDGYAVGFSNGFLSPNDIRRLENMDLIPAEEGGDDYYLNGSYTKLKNAGSAYGANAVAEQEKKEAEDPEEPEKDTPEEEPGEEQEEQHESKNAAQRQAQRKAQRRGGKPKVMKFWNWIHDDSGGRVLRLEGPIDSESFWAMRSRRRCSCMNCMRKRAISPCGSTALAVTCLPLPRFIPCCGITPAR
jgi:hypothetical protein